MNGLSPKAFQELDKLGYREVELPLLVPKPGVYAKHLWNWDQHVVLTIVKVPTNPDDWMATAHDRLIDKGINLREIDGLNVDTKGVAHFNSEEEVVAFAQTINNTVNRQVTINSNFKFPGK